MEATEISAACRDLEAAVSLIESTSEPTTAPSAPVADSEGAPEPEALAGAVCAAHANNLRELAAAAYLYGSAGPDLGEQITANVYIQYRNELLKDCGAPKDPLEVMLIEQLALAHHNIGRLHLRSAQAEGSHEAVAFAGAATRLLAEFRRCTLALAEYRAKQVGQKERSAGDDAAEEPAPTTRNRRTRSPGTGNGSSGGKKRTSGSKLTPNGEIPACIRQRLGNQVNAASRPTAAIGGNGKG